MMGDEWPSTRVFPNLTVDDGDDVRLGGLTLSVRELGPGESHVDSLWQLDASTVFAGDMSFACTMRERTDASSVWRRGERTGPVAGREPG